MSNPENPTDKPEKDANDSEQPAEELTPEELDRVAGGAKHIGPVKYEDITINVGTGMSKLTES